MCAARAPQVIGYTQIPLACWAMSGKACSLFWWAPERMPTAEQRAEKVAARQRARVEEAASRKARGLAVARAVRRARRPAPQLTRRSK